MSLWDWLINGLKKPDLYVAKSDHMMYHLKQCLKSNQFGDASNFVGELILTSVNRHNEGYLDASHIMQIPCERLQMIDQLWMYYSEGRFGFSVQYKILLECRLECGGDLFRPRRNYNDLINSNDYWSKRWKAEREFKSRVGWIDKNEKSVFCDLHNSSNFNQINCEDYPLGNLPYLPAIGGGYGVYISYGIETGRMYTRGRSDGLWFLILERLAQSDLQ